MFRTNQIVTTISKMNPHAPYSKVNKKSKNLIKIQKYSFLTSLLSLFTMIIMLAIYKSFDLPKEPFIPAAFVFYILNLTATTIFIITPIIPGVKFMLNLKHEVFNDLICEIDNDEQNIEKLMPYSVSELSYSIDWLNIKMQRLKSRVNDFFGEKTAILSIIGLAYSAVQAFGGLGKLGDTISKGLFSSGTANTLIVFSLAFLLGLSLGALILKHISNHLQYLKEILELAKKQKEQTEKIKEQSLNQ